MEYCEGGQVNDIEYMNSHDIDTLDVSRKLGDLYSEMIFVYGFVHCDPHPGNVLVNKIGNKTEIVLLDHGLYTVSFFLFCFFCHSLAAKFCRWLENSRAM